MSSGPNHEATKSNYEVANAWHEEKSLAHDWGPQRNRFTSRLRPKGKILEVGSGGSGRDTKEFLAQGYEVEALDYANAAVQSLRGKFPDMRVHEADMRKTGLSAGQFDGLWACASIVNLEKKDVPSALVEFYRLLKEGGQLFISAKEGGEERMVPDKVGERFFNFFSTTELEDLIRKAGFTVNYSEVTTGLAGTRWVCIYAVK